MKPCSKPNAFNNDTVHQVRECDLHAALNHFDNDDTGFIDLIDLKQSLEIAANFVDSPKVSKKSRNRRNRTTCRNRKKSVQVNNLRGLFKFQMSLKVTKLKINFPGY